jgi:hypothetical protein
MRPASRVFIEALFSVTLASEECIVLPTLLASTLLGSIDGLNNLLLNWW